MAEKVATTGVTRDKDFMYFVKGGDVWRVRRRMPNVPKGHPEKVVTAKIETDANYIYFLDRMGDVSRAKRLIGGQKRKKVAVAKKKAKKAARKRK